MLDGCLCMQGGEVALVLCLQGGKGRNLSRTLGQLPPGVWVNAGGEYKLVKDDWKGAACPA